MKKIIQIDEKIAKARLKLEEIKRSYEENTKKVEELNKIRASKIADQSLEPTTEGQKEVDLVTKEIDLLKNLIFLEGKDLIDALDLKIKDLELEKAEKEKEISYEKQKKLGNEAVDLSKKLIEELEACNLVNEKLRKIWIELQNLNQITGKGVILPGQKTTSGSFECLKKLLSVLSWEYNTGKPRPEATTRIMRW